MQVVGVGVGVGVCVCVCMDLTAGRPNLEKEETLFA